VVGVEKGGVSVKRDYFGSLTVMGDETCKRSQGLKSRKEKGEKDLWVVPQGKEILIRARKKLG